jgi:hypothetical protein
MELANEIALKPEGRGANMEELRRIPWHRAGLHRHEQGA